MKSAPVPRWPQGRTRMRAQRGMTIVELVVATSILAMIVIGTFASLLQSRRLTEGSVAQNSAVAIVQGYIEQMKNMEFAELPYTDSAGVLVNGVSTAVPSGYVPTRLDETTLDSLRISTAAIPALSTINIAAGTTTGIYDNPKVVDVNMTSGLGSDDLKMNLRIWIQDVSDSSINATQVRAITIHYAWQSNDGKRPRVYRGTVRTIRSAVPTY